MATVAAPRRQVGDMSACRRPRRFRLAASKSAASSADRGESSGGHSVERPRHVWVQSWLSQTDCPAALDRVLFHAIIGAGGKHE